jgi:hypothetical protein
LTWPNNLPTGAAQWQGRHCRIAAHDRKTQHVSPTGRNCLCKGPVETAVAQLDTRQRRSGKAGPHRSHDTHLTAGRQGLTPATTPQLWNTVMKNPKENDLAGRRKAAAEAKAALLKAHRDAKEAAEPTRLARQEERLAAAAAKDERQAERAKARREEQDRAAAAALRDRESTAAAAQATAEALDQDRKDRASSAVKDEATRKAERDRRYANRKARQK